MWNTRKQGRENLREKKYSSFVLGSSLIVWCSWIIFFKLKHWAVQVTCIWVCLCLVGWKYLVKGCVWIGRKTAFSNICLIYGCIKLREICEEREKQRSDQTDPYDSPKFWMLKAHNQIWLFWPISKIYIWKFLGKTASCKDNGVNEENSK